MTDDLMLLADSLGFQDLGHPGPSELPVTPPSVAADSEGRAGHRPVPGAVPYTLPPIPAVPSFDDEVRIRQSAPQRIPLSPAFDVPPGEADGPPPVGEGCPFDMPGETWRALSVDCPTWPPKRD
jgi:hypothetical protein